MQGASEMATLLRMPEVAANSTHATLAAWTKKDGDSVSVGDCLAEIETDKATVEFNAESSGTMGRLLVETGKEIAVGAPIGVLLAVGETGVDVDALLSAAAVHPAASALSDSTPAGTAATPALALASISAVPNATTIQPAGRIFASPLARRLATQRGVTIAMLKGSGPNGRIVKLDIDSAATAALIPVPPTPVVATTTVGYTEIPHSNMRRTIARRLSESKSTIPHFYLTVDCRTDRLLALRAEVNSGSSRKISVNDFIVRAVAVALCEVPGANVGWTDTAMRQYRQADIAVAVSTDTGLITPVIRSADTKSLSTISAEIADLSARARAGQLRPDEYQGGGFSVSNLGMFGVSEFSAIINPPQAAILAVGAVREQPVIENGELKIGSVMRCTLSVDHRAIDGAMAAQWLAAFKRVVEAPLAILL